MHENIKKKLNNLQYENVIISCEGHYVILFLQITYDNIMTLAKLKLTKKKPQICSIFNISQFCHLQSFDFILNNWLFYVNSYANCSETYLNNQKYFERALLK